MALLAVHMPYEEAKKVCEELTRLKTGRMTVHRTVQRLGSAACEEIRLIPAEKPKKEGETQRHVTADGVMVHIREEGWKEAKVGSVYEVDDERNAQETLYTATLESREHFGDQLYRLAPESRKPLKRPNWLLSVMPPGGWMSFRRFCFPWQSGLWTSGM